MVHPHHLDDFNNESEEDQYDNDGSICDDDGDDLIYDDRSDNNGDDVMFYGDRAQSSTSEEDKYWSKPSIFDEYSDDNCDLPTCNKDVKAHEDADIDEDTSIFNVQPDDKIFDDYRLMSYCNDHESSTKSMEEYLDLLFKEDGDIEIHYCEDPFMEVYASRSQPKPICYLIIRY